MAYNNNHKKFLHHKMIELFGRSESSTQRIKYKHSYDLFEILVYLCNAEFNG